MDGFLAFFEQMPAWQRVLWVMVCLGSSWVVEGGYPLVRLEYRKWRHAGVNSVFITTSMIINLLFGIATVAAVTWTTEHRFGLIYLVEIPQWVQLVLVVMLLDLTAQYLAHYLLHHVHWMWRFHVIHHSDRKVDATTGVRLHPGDLAVREVFALLAMILTGAPLAFYLFYRVVTVFFTFLAHANVAAPRWLDSPISLVFVTPNMHKFHHHFERPWTDSNYGGIFSLWDRLFRTFVYGDPRTVRYGLDVADGSRDEDLLYQLALPFDKNERLTR